MIRLVAQCRCSESSEMRTVIVLPGSLRHSKLALKFLLLAGSTSTGRATSLVQTCVFLSFKAPEVNSNIGKDSLGQLCSLSL